MATEGKGVNSEKIPYEMDSQLSPLKNVTFA